MSRGTQLAWPALALVMSFVAVFALTRLVSTPREGTESAASSPGVTESSAPATPGSTSPSRTPTPPATTTPTWDVAGLVFTIIRDGAQPSQENASPSDPASNSPRVTVVTDVPERQGVKLCLADAFAKQLQPEGPADQVWNRNGDTCYEVPRVGERHELRFVRK